MRVSPLSLFLRRLWAHDTFLYSLRVLIALSAVMGVCLAVGDLVSMMPLLLGVIACALAETDDSWRGRLRALLATLACFAVAAISVKALYPLPWLFGLGLALLAFCFTMLGAMGERYRAIAYGSVILTIYTTIGVEHVGGQGAFWREPMLLLAGAAWYGLLSVVWSALFANQPVQQKLAVVYRLLGDYLALKATLFEPVRGLDVEERRLALARLNGRLVEALNAAKESLFSRIGLARPGQAPNRYLGLYFIAQDVHERASSSHYPYNDLADAFFHSDVMFRCQRVLSLQGRACRRLAHAIRMRQPFELGPETQQAREDLDASMGYLRGRADATGLRLLRSVAALAGNLAALDRRLGAASNPDKLDDQHDSALFDRSPQSLRDAWDRIVLQLDPAAPLFRHALRLAVALAAGYVVVQLVDPSEGYWIMLTTIFVCAPSYGATRVRVVQRIAGTVLGLFCGWVLFRLFPDVLVQSVFAVGAGVVFFATRSTRYMLATAAMTLLVLVSFNQIGNGYDVFVPRLVDTLVGSVIAVLAMFVVLPDWQRRRLNQVAANAVTASARYLAAIMSQYETGKRDDLAYRLARRNAHNADAALSVAMSNMLAEPGHFRRRADDGLRFLVLSHTLLNYLSALGAHRDALPDDASDALLDRAVKTLSASLEEIAAAMAARAALPPRDPDMEALAQALEQQPDDLDEGHRLVMTQLGLIARHVVPLRKVAARLLAPEGEPAP